MLTILLTLKDRAPFTRRWMSYAESVRFPFKVLIADGGADESVPKLLSDKGSFPNVDYEYIRYPQDRSYADYYAKITDALARVRTPFVAMADNDDLYVVSGLKKAVDFLADHPEYASCGGQSALFWVGSRRSDDPQRLLYSPKLDWKCTRAARPITGETAAQRIKSLSLNTPDYYDVRRTETARLHFQIQKDLDPKDIFLAEFLISFLNLIAGKANSLDALYLARQHDPPESCGAAHEEKFGNWFGRMLIPSWSEDFRKFADALSAQLAEADRISNAEARGHVVAAYRMAVAPSLLQDIVVEPTVTMPISLATTMAQRFMLLPQNNAIRRMAQRLFRMNRWISLHAVGGTEFLSKKVSNAGGEIEPISRFLAAEAPRC